MTWQDHWEEFTAAERAACDKACLEVLLGDVCGGQFGRYHQIWPAIAARASLEQAGWTLYEVLGRDIDYLHRYHCADALLALIGDAPLKAVDLAGGHAGVSNNLETLEALLTSRIGDRPDAP
jgi:hypothetical protein